VADTVPYFFGFSTLMRSISLLLPRDARQ
jgi:hypothetical protein